MKKRVITLLLPVVIALTACTPVLNAGKEPAQVHPKPTVAVQATEAVTTTESVTEEATEETPASSVKALEVDLGTIDGNSYQNETLAIRCTFPENWYVYDQSLIPVLNRIAESMADSETFTEMIESGQTVIICCATNFTSTKSVTIAASRRPLSYNADEATIIRLTIPSVKAQMEETAGIENVVCDVAEAAFCGKTHSVLKMTCDSAGTSFYQVMLYLSHGDLLYNIAVASAQEADIEEILQYFEAIN